MSGFLSSGAGRTITNVYIETLSEVHPSLSPSLNTKSKLQTHGYKTAGGSGVEGGEWVASHSVGGKKQRLDPTTTST